METLDQVIAEHPFFQGLDGHFVKLAAGCAKNVRFDPGEYLFREGEEADHFFAIRYGRVAVEIFVPNRGPVTLQTDGPGDLIGATWLFPPYRNQFDARATELVRATWFDGTCLRNKCDADPALGFELARRLAHILTRRLEATRLQLLDVYGNAAGH